jgi:hypothetical protein
MCLLQIKMKHPNLKFYKNPITRSEVVTFVLTDGQTCMEKKMSPFCNLLLMVRFGTLSNMLQLAWEHTRSARICLCTSILFNSAGSIRIYSF